MAIKFCSTAFAAVLVVCSLSSAMADDPKPSGPPHPADRTKACVNDTGSRLTASNANCAATGHFISHGEIQQSGATTPAGALRHLDPSVTVQH